MAPGALSSATTIDCNEIDWGNLLEMAEDHGITPLLYEYIRNNREINTPDTFLNTLANRHEANKLRNRVLSQELFDILELFSTHNIIALAYKGPSLTLSVYGDLGLRHFGDLDILINTKDIDAASNLLTSREYNRKIPPLSPVKEKHFIRADHEHEFISLDQLVHIDLHWALSSKHFPFQLKTETLFSQSRKLDLPAGAINTISDQDMILLLCMHSNKDLWRKLIWVCDIDRLIRKNNNLNWDALMQQAMSSHCERMVYIALLISHELLMTPIPEQILQAAKNHDLVEQGYIIIQSSLENKDPEKQYLQCLAIKPFTFFLCDSYADKIRYIKGALITPTESDMMRYNLPSALHFVYYFLAPARKIFFCSVRFFKRLVLN